MNELLIINIGVFITLIITIFVSVKLSKKQEINIFTKKFIGAIGIPILWIIIFALFTETNSRGIGLIFAIDGAFVVAAVIGILVYTRSKAKENQKNSIAVVNNDGEEVIENENKNKKVGIQKTIFYFLIIILLPVVCLMINNAFGFSVDGNTGGLFGDFNNPLFYGIAVINGLLLLLPQKNNHKLRLIFFYLKSVGYGYIIYFFIVFLPILPLSILGMLFYGLGVLIFTPTFIAYLQGKHLLEEFKYLRQYLHRNKIIALFIAGLITIPAVLGIMCIGDKANLDTAMVYLENENTNKKVNIEKLEKTLNVMEDINYFTSNELRINSSAVPLLSNIYSKIVLSDRTFDSDNILTMKKLFLDKGYENLGSKEIGENKVDTHIKLKDIKTTTIFDKDNKVYRTWIDLELYNTTQYSNSEYVTEFELPECAYITDYYLYVGNEKKSGMLVDKRAAIQLYKNIVTRMQDPGIIRYIADNTIELRVFPFSEYQTRKTGFEIIHIEPIELNIDNKSIKIACEKIEETLLFDMGEVITASKKATLDKVDISDFKYYFIIDNSKASSVEQSIERVQEYTKENNINSAEVVFASYKLNESTLEDIKNIKYEADGGFNLEGAIKNILKKDIGETPIIIVASENILNSITPKSIYNYKHPESAYYYLLNYNMTLKPYSYQNNKYGEDVEKPIIENILNYKGVYVKDNSKSELVLLNKEKYTVDNKNQYIAANQLKLIDQFSYKEEKFLLDIVQQSFRNKVLTPYTAFMVVETTEQERQLLELQEKMLNNDMDSDTETIMMSEPSIKIIIIILVVLAIIQWNKKRVLTK